LIQEFRTGIGFDVHAFAENRKLIIGGVEIPFEKGLAGHSDADVLLHAISDALLGALALGDIGKHFPDDDPNFKNADSVFLLSEVFKMIEGNGYATGNIDAIVMLQKPKISPYVDEMRQKIANLLKVGIDRISIKATTTEKLGFTGREEGAAAMATVLLIKA
jgi:2-C-methyl-D-erythritol 2,4-cyclodiphosphate synthase